MKKIACLIVMMAIIGSTQMAYAVSTGKEWNTMNYIERVIYISSFRDCLTIIRIVNKKKEKSPLDYTVKTNYLVRIVDNYIDNHPEEIGNYLSLLVTFALVDEYGPTVIPIFNEDNMFKVKPNVRKSNI